MGLEEPIHDRLIILAAQAKQDIGLLPRHHETVQGQMTRVQFHAIDAVFAQDSPPEGIIAIEHDHLDPAMCHPQPPAKQQCPHGGEKGIGIGHVTQFIGGKIMDDLHRVTHPFIGGNHLDAPDCPGALEQAFREGPFSGRFRRRGANPQEVRHGITYDASRKGHQELIHKPGFGIALDFTGPVAKKIIRSDQYDVGGIIGIGEQRGLIQ